MVQFKKETLIALGFCGAVAVTTPLLSHAQMTDTSQWNQGQAELQKQLKPGMTHDSYRRKIEEMGYKITSTNYNNPDYLEYEVVKGDQTWEVQIDIDDNTRNATKIDISQNVWKTDATTAALEQAQNASRTAAAGADTVAGTATNNQRTTRMRNNQYSDRDRTTTDELVRELDALPVGHDKEYYKNTLRQRGYEITRVNKDDSDELELEAVKGGHSVQLEIEFDNDNMRSTEVDASTLWAESESTTRTRETQEQTLGSRSTSDQTSLNRDNDRRLNDQTSVQD